MTSKWKPKIDVVPPNTFEIICNRHRVVPDSDPQQWECLQNSSLKLGADLFSFWNTSGFSTKDEMVREITASLSFDDRTIDLGDWKYLTNRTDDSDSNDKHNAARFILRRGELVNQEVEFLFPITVAWEEINQLITNRTSATIVFEIDLRETRNRTIRCELPFGETAGPIPHAFVTFHGVQCREPSG